MIDRSRIRPSLGWLGLAAVPALAGVGLAILLLVATLDRVDGPYTDIDGPVLVQLDQGEGRGIWARTGASVSGFCSATGPRVADMKRTHGVSVTSGGVDYHSFLRFKAPAAGRYRVDCAASRPLSLGPYVSGLQVFAGVAGVLASFFGGLMLAGLVVALVLLLRERSTRRLELEARQGETSGAGP